MRKPVINKLDERYNGPAAVASSGQDLLRPFVESRMVPTDFGQMNDAVQCRRACHSVNLRFGARIPRH